MYKDNDHIYVKKILDKNITVSSNKLGDDIDKVIKDTLDSDISGICINEGYVKPNSTKILMRSEGNMRINNFKSVVYYTIKYEVMICCPSENQIIDCIVSEVSKSHITCYIDNIDTSPLNIFLTKQYHIGNEEYSKIKLGNTIKIKILATKFEYLDKQILVIGLFLK
jgi:DNA-directed RNA polymerase subunit E'/Rpb7